MAERNVGREIALSLGAAVVFGTGFGAYMIHSMPMPQKVTLTSPKPSDKANPNVLSAMDVARDVVNRFAAGLAAGRYDAAYALMAQPYKDAYSLNAFTKKCKSARFLAGAQSAALNSTRRVAIPGSSDTSYTFQGQGALVSAMGSIDAAFVFLVEHEQPRILVLSLAGIPVLDGVSGSPNDGAR